MDKFKEDNHAATNLLNYFIEYLVPCENPLIFSNAEEYNYYLKSFETRTLQGEKVKSYEECIVANYLYSQQILGHTHIKIEEMQITNHTYKELEQY